jgi:uncharacterized protein YhaN
MRWKAIRIVTVVAVSAFALVVAGCGSSKKSSATPSTTTTTTTETTTTESTPTTTETTTQSTSTTPNFATSGNCKDLTQSSEELSKALSGTGGDLQKSAQLFQNFADKAPSEIKGDVQTLADAFSKYADALKGVDLKSGQTPSAATLAKLQQASQEIDQAKVTQASQNISTWVQKNCSS